ncbi:MAG TPA: hypothetical protein VGR87_01555 [Candidatus Limnocylindria bacterium]|jgi:hypothetical protein|nr:hypothetical protein [Candidatus Limnocylindria bacterium]
MGTRIEDQPPEHWAGPESLDPTPVWKQFLLIGLFLVIGLVLVGGVAAFAIAPQVVTPPALVPGDRLVLPLSALPPDVGGAGAPPNGIGPPLIDEPRSFLLGRVDRTEVIAVRALWSPGEGQPECPVGPGIVDGKIGYMASCDRTAGRRYMFDARGNPSDGASRGLDRYLVSVTADRVIVNLGRLIVSLERTSAPPTPPVEPPGP